MSKPLPSHMKIRISFKFVVWSAGAVLAFMLIGGLKLFGLQDNSHTLLPTRLSGEVRLMSLTGFSTRPACGSKKNTCRAPDSAGFAGHRLFFCRHQENRAPPSDSLDETDFIRVANAYADDHRYGNRQNGLPEQFSGRNTATALSVLIV